MNLDILNSIVPLKYRLAFGLTFFLAFGVWDFVKNRENPKRAKEYGFVALAAFLCIIFAIFHDLITFNISFEYFSFGKGLGPSIQYFPDIVLLALKGSYWVGILIGVLYVVANNPSKILNQLHYNELIKYLTLPLTGAIVVSFLAVIISYIGYPFFTKGVGTEVLKDPKSFELVVFIHYGTYIGGLLGTLVGIFKIRTRRRDLA